MLTREEEIEFIDQQLDSLMAEARTLADRLIDTQAKLSTTLKRIEAAIQAREDVLKD